MKTITRSLSLLAACGFALGVLAAASPKPSAPLPTLTDAEKQAGWKLLFDGKTPAGWRKLGGGDFPADKWGVENGCLRKLPGKAGDLIYEQPFENFELSFEWLVPKPNGNSGVKYRVQEKKGNSFAYGPEYQVMADGDASDKNATGSLYDVLPPQGKKLKGPGEFNESRIVVKGEHVEHWLNGVKVVEYQFGSEAFKAGVARSKFKNDPKWAAPARGYVALQDHGDEVWFRNIKARELPAK
jgi:hypothetical protein